MGTSTNPACLLLLVSSVALLGERSAGGAELPEKRETSALELLANDETLWIYPEPSFDKNPIGYARAGGALTTRARDPSSRRGCSGGWYAVEPQGYVCRDRRASFTPTRYTRGARELTARGGASLFHYALSLGAPAYRRLPSEPERRRSELPFGPPGPRGLPSFWAHYGQLADADHPAPGELDWFFEDGGSISREQEPRLVRRNVPLGSTVAFVKMIEQGGQRFALASDGTLIPSERLRSFRRSTFQGVELAPSGVTLPVGFTRRPTSPLLKKLAAPCPELTFRSKSASTTDDRRSSGALPRACLEEEALELGVRTPLLLDERSFEHDGRKLRFVKALDSGREFFLPEAALFIAEERPRPSPELERWMHFSIGRGTLVAYEGDEPRFVTLASPGADGASSRASAALPRATPLGLHRIQFKHRTDDMSPDWGDQKSHVMAEVPHAMYFSPPFAVHVAYWHEDFGEPRSGGCVNVSPLDGERLFSWTSPKLPPGWHGVAATPQLGIGTAIWIER